MKTFLKFFAILLIAMTLVACSAITERFSVNLKTYIWLEREGMFDPEVPTSKVHDLLTRGLYHQDPEIFTCSISTIVWYVGVSDTAAFLGNPRPVDRRLGELPGLYKLFTGLWEEGWTESGGIVPDVSFPDDIEDRVRNKTGCLMSDQDPVWPSLVGSMVFLFPRDEKVHDIIWKQLPQSNPDGILSSLYEGKFNTRKDQQHRIDILTNPKTNRYDAILAAKSLGEFRAEGGVEALAKVLREDILAFVPPKMTIVEAMLKYEAEAVPHVALMRKMLSSARTHGAEDRERKKRLQERFTQWEQEYGVELVEPSG